MKKHIITLLFVLLTGLVFSNPFILPPVISELYWDDAGNWSMELVFNVYPNYNNNLDGLSLVCNDDTSAFVTGIPIVLDQPIVITKDDLLIPFEILIDSGFVFLVDNDYQNLLGWGMMFGDYEESRVTAVAYGQSIVYQRFWLQDVQEETFWLVKETQPTIGSLPFSCQTRADFNGIVLDTFLIPVPDAHIKYAYDSDYENAYSPSIPILISDENGEFSTYQMFCQKYTVMIFVDSQRELITHVNIEPDSANYYEFILDTLNVGINTETYVEPKVSMTTRPNPFNRNLDIHIQMNSSSTVNSPIVKLFDLNGNLVKSSDINSPYLNNLDIHWGEMDELEMSPGLYVLVLEAEGKILASQKLIYQK